MAQDEIKYTIPNDGQGHAGSQVDIIVTYDQSSPNDDGSFTLSDASGFYRTLDVDGNTIDTDHITGLSSVGGLGGNDNRLFCGQDPCVDFNGITFIIDNVNDGNDPAAANGQVNFYNDGSYREGGNNFSPAEDVSDSQIMCFASGTRISTPDGDKLVEALVVGDLVVTASGATRPIRWLGHRTLDDQSRSRMPSTSPICIAANAFGAGLPMRKLYLSPGHPVLVGADEDNQGGYLVPIMCLINGTTIAPVNVASFTYWHVELDAHDILLADGLPAESYFEWGDRAFFAETSGNALVEFDVVAPGLTGRCRPVIIEGPLVEAERRRIDALFVTKLSDQCAWPTSDTSSFDFWSTDVSLGQASNTRPFLGKWRDMAACTATQKF